MAVLDPLFSIGAVRKAIWRWWYPFLTRRLRDEAVLFLNYAYEEDPPMRIPLRAEDEPHRAWIQLYHHVASQAPLRGLDLLEVSCGHGGGAAYLTRTHSPRSYTGVDLNPEGIAFCQRQHRLDGLAFEQGDAMQLPFESDRFDAVINIEASHCYPDFPHFLTEVARVLRPGGVLLYADFRFEEGLAAWEQAIRSCPLERVHHGDIHAEVLRGMNTNSARSLELVRRHLPGWLHALGRDFAGVEGSRLHRALRSGELSYRSYCLKKPLSSEK